MLHRLRTERCLYRSRPAKPGPPPDLPSGPEVRRDLPALVGLVLRQFQQVLVGLVLREDQPALVGLVHQPVPVRLRDLVWAVRNQRPQAS
jgi:hypothetical protein